MFARICAIKLEIVIIEVDLMTPHEFTLQNAGTTIYKTHYTRRNGNVGVKILGLIQW